MSRPESAQIWKIRTVAEYLRVSPATIYLLLKRHQIPGFKIGNEWHFNAEDIDRCGWNSQS